MKNMKFAKKFLLVILSVSIISMLAVFTISYIELLNLSEYSQEANIQLGNYASENSKEALIRQAEIFIGMLSLSQAAKFDELLVGIEGDILAIAEFVEALYRNPGNFQGRRLPLPDEVSPDSPSAQMMLARDAGMTPALQREMLLISNSEYVVGSVLAVNPSLHNIYVGTETGIFFTYSTRNENYYDFDPRTRPWYNIAHDTDGPIWLDAYVYIDGTIGITCAKAFRDAGGNIAGVVAADILISTIISDILIKLINEIGYTFLLDSKGHYLAHPLFQELNLDALGTAQGEHRNILENMMAGDSGVRHAEIRGVDYYVAYAPLSIISGSLGIAIEYDQVISGALSLESNIERQALMVRDQIRIMLNNVMISFIILTCIVIVTKSIVSILVSRSVTKPLSKLTEGVIEVGKGKLDSKIDIQTKDEIGVLASCFNKMTEDLKDYIADLSKVTAERERIGAELSVATHIQASMLPCVFPPFPDRNEFDIYASMQPAKEVGGDFYDIFLVDDNTLAVVMADVSGKGVPAALFMVIAKTLIKSNAQNGKSPKEVFEIVNNLLCEGNDADMFVTAFMGFLDLLSGKFIYVNAGHNPPLFRHSDGDYGVLSVKPGFVLAGLEGISYRQYEISMQIGDELFLYTDGVTEAANHEHALFGEARLLDTINRYPGYSLKEITISIKGEIKKFEEGAEQADDITMLVLRYNGFEKNRKG